MRSKVALGVVVALGLAVATPASGVVVQPTPVPLMPGAGSVPDVWGSVLGETVVVTSDAVYALMDEPDSTSSSTDSVLFTRSLAADDTSVTLGRSTRVARASGFSMAEYDGTIAYLRRVDGRLVLRAPDGTETLPAWGADPRFASCGPSDMDDTWVIACQTLFNRSTGVARDLIGTVTDIPAAAQPNSGVQDVVLAGDRVLFTTYAAAFSGDTWVDYSGVYTVALDGSGPVGTAQRLAGVEPDTNPLFEPVGLIADHLVWSAREWVGTFPDFQVTTTVSAVPLANPGVEPTTRTFAFDDVDFFVLDAGDSVAVWGAETTEPYAITDMVWYDPADPSTDLRVYSPDGDAVRYAADNLVIYDVPGATPQRTAMLVDLAHRTMTADASLPAPPRAFTDVTAANAFAANISWLTDLGITTGYPDGTFRPTGTVNRAAMAAFLYRFAGEPEFTAPATSPFRDVATSHPFYREIAWLADVGISTGTVTPTGAYFKPADNVSREAMAAFLYRFAGSPAFDSGSATSPFADVEVTHPFYKAISWLALFEISTGTVTPTGVYYKPRDTVSRQAMAAFLNRMHALGFTRSWTQDV